MRPTETALMEISKKQDEICRTVTSCLLNVHMHTCITQRGIPYFTKKHTYLCLLCSRQEDHGRTHTE